MPEFALITAANAFIKLQDHASQPPDPTGKNWRWVPTSRITGTGGSYLQNDVWIIETPPQPAPVRVATARQFKAALVISGVITEAEVTSPNLPAIAEPVVSAFPDAAMRIVARSTWANMTTVPENDPLLEAMRQAAGMTLEQKVALFDLALSIE
jgi:hypothetical protein